MIYIVIGFLWAAILLYLLLGGADFGAGIIEFFTSRKNKAQTRDTLYHAIGPVWEANHMWLIIAIVILFVGFPDIYATMSVYLHIPLTIMLIGIIARGTAFAFRHYDAVVDEMQYLYNKIFMYSSIITPLFLGIIAGTTVSRSIDTRPGDFVTSYIFTWLDGFPIAVGFFTVAICGYLAAVYLIGEAKHEQDRKRFIVKARSMNIAAIVCGMLVFVVSLVEKIPLFTWIFGSPTGIIAVLAASLSLVLMWHWIGQGKTKIIRLAAGFQVTMILLTITYNHFPDIILLKDGGYLSLMEHHGHDKTIQSLGWALLLGSVFILPALFYLMYSFQKKPVHTDE